jgi:integrating conjugative element protein (TIGR03752 family)
MPTNKLILVGVLVLAGLLTVVVLNTGSDPKPAVAANEKPADKQSQDKPKKAQVKDVSGDTVDETLRETQGKITRQRMEQQATAEQLKEKIAELEREMAERDARRDQQKKEETDRIMNEAKQQLNEEVAKVRAQFNQSSEAVSQLRDQFENSKGRDNADSKKSNDDPARSPYKFNDDDLGLSGNGISVSGFSNTLMPGYVALKPLHSGVGGTTLSDLGRGLAANQRFANGAQGGSNANGLAPQIESVGAQGSGGTSSTGGKKDAKKPKNKSIPYYTLHANSTSMDATAMTAMIGRVPVGGRVGDRFPVKVILGDDTLSANGHRIPGLKGIVFSGLATGNWNLSCVSVALTSATFVFKDGRIQHLPSTIKSDNDGLAKEQDGSEPLASQGSSKVKESIGYISTRDGVPCIGGKRITDAEKQLFTMGVLGAAKSYFDAKAKAETTQIASLSNGVSGSVVTGNSTKFANNETAANSIGTVMDFYKDRMRDTFDVIFVDPGQPVAVNIERDLLIDYNTNARKIVYNHDGGAYEHSLD